MDYICPAIRDDFEAVNRTVVEKLRSEVGLVENIGQYIVDGGGKRLRPLISLLSAKALDYRGARHIDLAAAIEFLHTATLLHDDVVDVSTLRRGRATANANWGNAPSVLVGDFIYSRAFQLLVGIGDMRILALISDTTNAIAEGEVEQLVRSGDPATTEQQYLEVIRKKTAVLFAAAAQAAGMLAHCSTDQERALHDFGLNLGLAFQLIDDALDYEGDPAAMGKNIGDDLAEGKMTLPLIHALQCADSADQELIRAAVRNKSGCEMPRISHCVRSSGALDYTRSAALRYRDIAISSLDLLPACGFRDNLHAIAELTVSRRS